GGKGRLTGGQGVAGSNPAIPTTFLSYSYDAEKKAAMEFWHRQLTAILANKPIAAARAPTSSAHTYALHGTRFIPGRARPRHRRSHRSGARAPRGGERSRFDVAV